MAKRAAMKLLGMTLLLASCAPQGSAVGEDAARDALRRMSENSGLASAVTLSADGSRSSTVATDAPRYGLADPHQTTWIFDPMPEELELIKLGHPALGPIMAWVSDRDRGRDLRGRLALVAARLGDESVALTLFTIGVEERDPVVQDCFFTAVGLLGKRELIHCVGEYLKDHPPAWHAILWAVAKSGSPVAGEQYENKVEEMISLEQTEDVLTGLPLPRIRLSEEGSNPYLQAKQTPETVHLPMNLWRLSRLPSSRVVRILISALGYHESHVQHMALRLLEGSVQNAPAKTSHHDYDLHSLDDYRTWMQWWTVHGSNVRWDPSQEKYMTSAMSGKR